MKENRTQKQIEIDAELELEMIPIRKENKKAVIEGLGSLAFLFVSLWLLTGLPILFLFTIICTTSVCLYK